MMKNNGLGTKSISKLIKQLLIISTDYITEVLPSWIIQEEAMLSRKEAFTNIHFPSNTELLKNAHYRLSFEEYFFFQLHLLHRKLGRQQLSKGHVFSKVGDLFNTFFYRHLPFS
ncbi:hypothetical protein RZS08_47370, partial [Arthrospira platensis SPKY1]|nr:hypothetical protein [Arthrospira platensis SPKY1]